LLQTFAEAKTEDFILNIFMTSSIICLTKGKDGVVLSSLDHGMYHQRQGLLMIKDNRCWRCILDWFLYAQLLNKNFEQTITIAQKISGVETSTLAD
jgi:fructokinase